MFLSFFSDELAIDFAETLPTLQKWGLKHVDLRGRIFGKPVDGLSDAELKDVKRLAADHGMAIGSLQSSLAKVHLPAPERLRSEEQKLENLIRAADALDTRLVRAFHYWQPPVELRGKLGEQPDQMQMVLDAFAPLAKRAREAGLILAFENCGVTPDEVYAFLDALGEPSWGIAWDAYNHWDEEARKTDEAAYIAHHVQRSKMVHVKAAGTAPGLTDQPLPWDRILAAAYTAGLEGPVSIETHNPRTSTLTNEQASYEATTVIQRAWPTQKAASVLEAAKTESLYVRPYADNPVGFVVVGLGMGNGRSRLVTQTSGCKLIGVCDKDEERCKKTAEACGVPYKTDLGAWLEDDRVDVVYVLTPTGLHADLAVTALKAGKHVLTTKPMEASLERCDLMIDEAEKAGKLLAVDFDQRFLHASHALKQAIEGGWFGKILNVTAALKILRTEDYFKHNGGWRGTKRLDGGGVLSNQCIHLIDKLHFLLGMPSQIRCDIFTQHHPIEAEDLGCALWKYDNGTVVNLHATSTYQPAGWYQRTELHGTEGAFSEVMGYGRGGARTQWYKNKEWSALPPVQVKSPYACAADNLAAAIRTGVPLTCPGREGRRTQAILDAMYRSAAENGAWVSIDAAQPATV